MLRPFEIHQPRGVEGRRAAGAARRGGGFLRRREREGAAVAVSPRTAGPIDQALAVLFFVSDDDAFITGEDLRVDGGALATCGLGLKSVTPGR